MLLPSALKYTVEWSKNSRNSVSSTAKTCGSQADFVESPQETMLMVLRATRTVPCTAQHLVPPENARRGLLVSWLVVKSISA